MRYFIRSEIYAAGWICRPGQLAECGEKAEAGGSFARTIDGSAAVPQAAWPPRPQLFPPTIAGVAGDRTFT
jgi:hypothetical protein